MRRDRQPSPQTIAVLFALDAAGHTWSHGYELCRDLDLKAGTVYPILIRLAERGIVETTWESDPPQGRPARHLYRLSSAGADYVTNRVVPAAAKDRAIRHSPGPVLGAAGA